MPLATDPRSGSTRVELVLVGLILILVGLLIVPAVNKIRELSNRVECQNRLQRLAQALHMHHDQKGVFPSLGGHAEERQFLLLNRPGGPTEGQRFGLGSPFTPPENQAGSWIYQILPYLDADATAQINRTKPTGHGLRLKILLCPARRRLGLLKTPAKDPWFANTTYSSTPPGLTLWARSDYAANGRLLPVRGQPLVRFSKQKPGLGNAILVGEKWLDTRTYTSGGWVLDGPALAGGRAACRTGSQVLRDSALPSLSLDSPQLSSWGSAHTRGTHFLFADGQVRWIGYHVSEQLLERLLGPTHELPDFEEE